MLFILKGSKCPPHNGMPPVYWSHPILYAAVFKFITLVTLHANLSYLNKIDSTAYVRSLNLAISPIWAGIKSSISQEKKSMGKSETLCYKPESLIVFALCIILLSCKGPENKSDLQNVIKESKTTSIESNLEEGHSDNQSGESLFQFYGVDHQISDVVRTVFQDSKGYIWFGTQDGAFRYDGNSLIHIDGIKSESGKGVTIKDITEDKDGKIWLGHSEGISSIDGELVVNYYETDGLLDNDVWCIAADTNGSIWIGTIAGVCVYNGLEFTNFKLPEGKTDPTVGVSSTKMVHSIMEDSKGTLWFSSNAGLFSYANNNLVDVSDNVGIQTNFVNEVYEDEKGVLWISTKKHLFRLREKELTNITKDKIEVGKGIGSIAEDKKGNIWFTSNQHNLYSYDGKEIIEYQKSEDNKGPVIFQIYRDQDDRLWFVGYGGAYRLENGKLLNITKHGPW